MNVLLVSQCSKRALTETRRILDQFAERKGDRTWLTPITMQGLDTLRKLLKKTARKNTAVACHWLRGHDHNELLWIVGDASQFDDNGTVATNVTACDILRTKDENDWHTGEDIKLLARMAALWHDFGKANAAFQTKIKPSNSNKAVADAYRHEWVSLRLFEAFVRSCGGNDNAWLERLQSLSSNVQADMGWLKTMTKDGLSDGVNPFKGLPDVAQAVGWLIVSHHRLPTNMGNELSLNKLKKLPDVINSDWAGSRFVDDDDAKALKQLEEDRQACWQIPPEHLPFASRSWCEKAAFCAAEMLKRPTLAKLKWVNNPYAMHLSRLVLMLADHYYSSVPKEQTLNIGDKDFLVYANTDRATNTYKQKLDNHLLGVERHARKIMGNLPNLQRELPRLARHKGFRRRADKERFRWQDKAFDLAESIRDKTRQQGFFGVNMASTGCGKTLANGRIMYALADPKHGARFAIALGLRTLTLQTGQAYRERLGIADDDLAVMVGGAAVRELYEHHQQKKVEQNDIAQAPVAGSDSSEALLPDNSYVAYEGILPSGGLGEWLQHNSAAHKLLAAPLLVCTVDHLMPAVESTRGGHQIAPMLRLLTSDLVLDEPDDFGLDDLPALTRLVHWAGLLGSRVLLSSATLPPALITGLFNAYCSGRACYQQNRGEIPNQAVNVCCAWFDEFQRDTGQHATEDSFLSAHKNFVTKRLQKLQTQALRRQAFIADLAIKPVPASQRQYLADQLGACLPTQIQQLHQANAVADPYSGKHVSFGLIRMANIDPMIDVAQALLKQNMPDDWCVHLCVYHSRFPLLLRSNIEAMLDTVLNRQQSEAVFKLPMIQQTLMQQAAQQHVFVVLASPVAEVGRDHDYDWAIVEPSSMRSLIQLAGRIRRHRPSEQDWQQPNICLWPNNFKSLQSKKICFNRPGFEDGDHLLTSHDVIKLILPQELQRLDAAPRIAKRDDLKPSTSLVDLEHQRLQELMLDEESGSDCVATWWKTQAHLSGMLQHNQRFRKNNAGEEQDVFYGLVVEDADEGWHFQCYEPKANTWTLAGNLVFELPFSQGQGMCLWRPYASYLDALESLANDKDMSLKSCSMRFGTVSLPEREQGWWFDEFLGFQRKL